MNENLRRLFRSMAGSLNIGVTKYANLQSLLRYPEDIDVISHLPIEILEQLLPSLGKSKSQCKQDLFVLVETGFKRNGYFVEFGATNGVDLSNSYLLEKEFGWSGIVAEPARTWHDKLVKNRNCNIELRCVWRTSGTLLTFNEVESAELSTISTLNPPDGHRSFRKRGQSYPVETISLMDLLEKYEAPREIDYLSIDTEGSEFEILSGFDFNKYHIKVITCEHNFTPLREKIFELLLRHGYVRKFTGISRWDDWFVRQTN